MPVLYAGTKRILYIHVPKTGGTSVERLLSSMGEVVGVYTDYRRTLLPCTPQHFHADLLRQTFSTTRGDIANFDFVFMTVRDPIQRLSSEYRFQQTHRSRRRALYESVRYRDADAWARSAVKKFRRDPYLYDNHIRPQVDFLLPGTEVFRLEDGLRPISTRLHNLLDVTNGEELPRENSSQIDPKGFSASTRNALREFYAEDYRVFYPHASIDD